MTGTQFEEWLRTVRGELDNIGLVIGDVGQIRDPGFVSGYVETNEYRESGESYLRDHFDRGLSPAGSVSETLRMIRGVLSDTNLYRYHPRFIGWVVDLERTVGVGEPDE